MPILNMSTQLLIVHPKAGIGEEIEQLGEMSTELAIWLDGRLLEDSLAPEPTNSSNQTSNPNQTNSSNSSNSSKYWDQPHLRSLHARCMLAAQRGYKHALCDPAGNLTQLGQDKARQAQRVLTILNEYNAQTHQNEFFAYEPQKWTQATDCLIKANLSMRAISLLQLISSAVAQAEEAYNKYAQDHPNETQDPDAPDILDLINPPTSEQKAEKAREARTMADFDEIDPNLALAQDLHAMLYLIGTRRREAWVPTATFGQRARTDMKTLVRFGLIDLKVYIAGGRGRPRHVLRLSPTGRILLNDLHTKKILN